jgi:hypothetical protein
MSDLNSDTIKRVKLTLNLKQDQQDQPLHDLLSAAGVYRAQALEVFAIVMTSVSACTLVKTRLAGRIDSSFCG